MALYVEIITSPNCIHSPKAVKLITNLTKKSKSIIVREISLLTEEGKEMAEGYEIESTPSITINGELVCEGLPGKEEIKKLLEDYMYKDKERTSYFF